MSFQENLSKRLQEMQRKRENADRMVRYYREKATGTQSLGISEDRNKLLSDLTRADQIISSLEDESSELAAELAREEIVTFEDGKYTDEMRQCCMSLLSHNVGVNNVGKVIVDVLQLANKKPCRLPSVTLLKQMLIEGRAVSLAQLSELHEVSDGNTLHYDGTTKKGRKYGSFQLSNTAGQYTLSVNDLVSGSAEHTLDLLKQVVSEISEAGKRSKP